MSDFDSVRAVAAQVADELDVLDVLVHNAGSLSPQRAVAGDGTELTLASQLLGPFLLTSVLLPNLSRSDPGRVVTVSSGGMYSQRFDLGRLEMNGVEYDGTTAYARVKRAQLVLPHEWARRVIPPSVVFHAMHPGWADTPGVRSSLPGFYRVMRPLLRSSGQGADTIVWLAAAPEVTHTSGDFWLDRHRRWEHKVPWTRPRDAATDQGGYGTGAEHAPDHEDMRSLSQGPRELRSRPLRHADPCQARMMNYPSTEPRIPPTRPKVLVTGQASGYVGGRLVPRCWLMVARSGA